MSSDLPPSFAPPDCVGPTSDDAGKSSSCSGCPNQQICSSGEAKILVNNNDIAVNEVKARLSNVKHKILVLSGKGGVGKSTMTTQLAWFLSSLGANVGVCDVDICGPSIPHMLGVSNHEVHQSSLGWEPVYANETLSVMSVAFLLDSVNDAVIWRGPRKNGLIKQFLGEVNWPELDFLLIDAPPGTSDEHLAVNTYLSQCNIDGAIIIATPQAIALLDVRKEITFCQRTHIPIIGVVENMSGFSCSHCGNNSRLYASTHDSVSNVCQQLNVSMLGRVPLDPDLMSCCDAGIPYHQTCPTSPSVPYIARMIQQLLQTSPSLQETDKNLQLSEALEDIIQHNIQSNAHIHGHHHHQQQQQPGMSDQ